MKIGSAPLNRRKMATIALLSVVWLFCFNGVLGARVLCDLYDSDCVTRASHLKYPEFLRGIPGVEPSDPLHQDLIVGDLPKIKYTLKDATLSGLSKCFIEVIRFSKDQTFDLHVRCPHLTLKAEYDMKGDLVGTYVEGKGSCKVDFYDYGYFFHGNYELNKRDGKTFIQMKTYTLNMDIKGKIEYDLENLYSGDKEKSDAGHKLMNDNWKAVDEEVRQPTMEAFMKKHMENANKYLNIVSAEEIISYEQ